MSDSRFTTPLKHPWIYFLLAVIPTMAAFLLYGANIIAWRNSPDFGWRAMYESGPNIAADLFELAHASGLKTGDQIVAINGREYSTFEELFFEVRNPEQDSINVYTVLRGGQKVEVNIKTGRLGLFRVLQRSGPLFFLGFIYFMIGVLVFLMKPRARESRLFLVQTAFFGLMICYQSPTDLFKPLWLFDLRNVIEVFMPAPMMHLALRFPKTRSFIIKQPKLLILPYLVAFILLVLRMRTMPYWNIPPVLNHVYNLFIMAAVLSFLISVVWNFFKDPSAAVKVQSQAIMVGIFIGFFIPVADLVVRSYLNIYLFPDPVIGFMTFLTAFPLSIGFTIVKYDLFAIDTVIKRTYGYLLTTGAIAGIYGIVITVINLAFGRFEVTQSPAFPMIFILAVVFFFNPIHNRVQRVIDRVFYRLEYDYQDTVHKISETMRTLLGLDEISKNLIRFSMGTMFIDSGAVMLLNRDKGEYVSRLREGESEDQGTKMENHAIISIDLDVQTPSKERLEDENATKGKTDITLLAKDPLVEKITARKKAVTIYDVQGDPFFEDEKEACEKVFKDLDATMIVPLIYEDKLIGLLALGQKKSGKFYRREDVNLLNILANQGAVAIENAIMIEEVIEKERMEEELNIAKDLQVSMLPSENPEIEGLEIASYSMSAREVGGDFYDFIAMGEEKVGMLIGDVTGKSVSGALVMSASRSIFRMLSEEDRTVADIMIRANRRMKKDIKSGMFVALLYAVVNARERTVDLCSAGQTQPIHLAADTGDVHLVETEGDTFPLGILEDVEYEDTRLTLKPGDTVVFYTDGIVEAMNAEEELFGFKRLDDVIQNSTDLSAQELLDKILDQVNTFAAGTDQHDDITVIIIKVAA